MLNGALVGSYNCSRWNGTLPMWSGCDGGEDTGAAVGCSTMGARGRTRVLDVAMDIVKSTQKDEGGRKEGAKEGARDGKEGSSWVDMCDGVCVFLNGKEVARKRNRTVPFRFCLEKVCHPKIQQ
jgi:hypothetical protein